MCKIVDLLEKCGICASNEQANDFEKWLVNTAWLKYNDDKMNQRIIIENAVKSLGLRFPNGTIGKTFSAQLVIPSNLVDDIWIEGFEELGLNYSIEPSIESNTAEQSSENNGDIKESLEVVNESDLQVKSATTESSSTLHDMDKNIVLQITGKPITPGDFTLKLAYKHKGWLHGEPVTEIKLPIAFNPDPRSLWKNIPTSENISFYKPDYSSEDRKSVV